MIRGKGFYVWNADNVLRRSGAANAQEAALRARSAGIQHVIVKIADGENPFPLPGNEAHIRKEAITAELIGALREAGIVVWGWAFAYGPPANPEAQAEQFAARARHFGLSGLVIDAENFGNRIWSSPEGPGAATAYIRRLRSAMAGEPDLLVGLSSYRYIRYHRNFPFAEFMAGCDVAMPQVYWVARSGGDAVRNLQESYDDYKDAFPRALFLPTGAAYGEEQSFGGERWFWSATPQQVQRFLDQANAMRLPAVTFWSWEHARHDRRNRRFPGTELWEAIAQHPFGQLHDSLAVPAGAAVVRTGPALVVGVVGDGYADGRQPEAPGALLTTFERQGRTMKFAPSVSEPPAGVWALWRPALTASGTYDISIWVPGEHATVRRAGYQIHGVAGEPGPITFQVNQRAIFDDWISLGRYALDHRDPLSGQVRLTNATGQTHGEVAFAEVRWQRLEEVQQGGQRLADGYDAPVGSEQERRSAQVWPGHWVDATGHGTRYVDSGGSAAFHTGADLNLNVPEHDLDREAPVFAVADGVVTFAGRRRVWGNIVIIRHDPLMPGGNPVYSRSAHLETIQVSAGQRVQRGEPIGRIGRPEPAGSAFHLHFDLSPTKALEANAADWPGLNESQLHEDYVDPAAFIREHRPRGEE